MFRKGWIQQHVFPNAHFSRPVALDNREFVMVPSCTEGPLVKYDIALDAYKEWIKFPLDYNYGSVDNILLTAVSNNIIHFFTKAGNVCTFNLQTNQWGNSPTNPNANANALVEDAAHVTTQHGIHILCAYHYQSRMQHLMWIPKSCAYENRHKYQQCAIDASLSNPGLVHIKSQNRLLLLGGYDTVEWASSIAIYSCDTITFKWTKTNTKLAEGMDSFGCVLTMDEKYVLVFGGSDANSNQKKSIYILDTESMVIMESDMYCPLEGEYYAYLLFDCVGNDLIVNGYIKYCWRLKEFKHLRKTSDDIIAIIQSYHFDEMIHLFEKTSGRHWKIKVDHIINHR